MTFGVKIIPGSQRSITFTIHEKRVVFWPQYVIAMTDLLLLNELNIDSHGTKFNLYYDLFFFCLNEKRFTKSALIHFMYYSIIHWMNFFNLHWKEEQFIFRSGIFTSGVNVQKNSNALISFKILKKSIFIFPCLTKKQNILSVTFKSQLLFLSYSNLKFLTWQLQSSNHFTTAIFDPITILWWDTPHLITPSL